MADNDGFWSKVSDSLGMRGVPVQVTPGTALQDREEVLRKAREELLMQQQRLQGNVPQPQPVLQQAPVSVPQPAAPAAYDPNVARDAMRALDGLGSPVPPPAYTRPAAPQPAPTLRNINPSLPRPQRRPEDEIIIHRTSPTGGVRG